MSLKSEPKPGKSRKHMTQSLNAQLDMWRARLRDLETSLSCSSQRARVDLLEKKRDLQKRFDELDGQLGRLRASASDAWEEVSEGCKRSWKEFANRLESAVSEFKKSDSSISK